MSTVALEDIAARVAEGQRLSDADADALVSTYDIVSLGMVADDVRRGLHGVRTTFLRVAAFGGDMVREPLASVPPSAREVRVTGSFPGIDEARRIVSAAAAVAGSAAVTAYSLADLERAASGELDTVRRWLESLRDAGLGMVAEAPADLLEQTIPLVRTAQVSGVPVARVTVWTSAPAGPLEAIRMVERLQAETGAVRAFAPIPRRPGPEPTTGYEDVRAVALARILLPEVEHIQADWTLHGPKLAQVALIFGADDMDNVSPLDEVAEGRRRAPLEEIRRNTRAAGFEAAERDARFAIVS
jgi:2-iminoacetate synthase ThiH